MGPRDERPLLPDETDDDTDAGWGVDGSADDDARLRWLLDERPPHHDQ